jgi:uncharacterized protein YjbJ (UPF0337 family)
MEDHSVLNDMFGDTSTANDMTGSAIIVGEVLSGDYSNLKEGMTLNLSGTSKQQYAKIKAAFQKAVNASSTDNLTKIYFKGKPVKD